MNKKILFSNFSNNPWEANKRIRSFVKRQSRMTKGQKYALNKLWPTMGIDYKKNLIDFNKIFGSVAPVILEIGFGMGSSIVNMASTNIKQNFIGIEVYLPGIGTCLANAEKAGINNLRIINHDAVEVLEHMIPDMSLTSIQLFFPDPWYKLRHNKRRIIQASFIKIIAQKLNSAGIFHVVTDWQPYAEHILKLMRDNKCFRNLSSTNNYVPRLLNRPLTKFELRGHKLGYNIRELMFKKIISYT